VDVFGVWPGDEIRVGLSTVDRRRSRRSGRTGGRADAVASFLRGAVLPVEARVIRPLVDGRMAFALPLDVME